MTVCTSWAVWAFLLGVILGIVLVCAALVVARIALLDARDYPPIGESR